MTEAERQHVEAVIAIIEACTVFPVTVSVGALTDALGSMVVATSRSPAEIKELQRAVILGLKASVASHAGDRA